MFATSGRATTALRPLGRAELRSIARGDSLDESFDCRSATETQRGSRRIAGPIRLDELAIAMLGRFVRPQSLRSLPVRKTLRRSTIG